jgi:DNA (cytosine-5)-methyltransferase 1
MTTIELFCGIGGFRLAMDALGHRTIWANDLSEKACKVYRSQFGKGGLHEGDFAKLKEGVPAHDILTGGFPCQPFSSAGKKEGTRDARGTLFQHIVALLKKHRPKFFVLENVKRLLTMEQGCHFATILGALAELDYFVEWRLLNAMDFGLPQSRERVFITGELLEGGSRDEDDFGVKLASVEDLLTVKPNRRERLFEVNDWREIPDHKSRFEDWGMACCGKFVASDLQRFSAASPLTKLSSVLEAEVAADFDFTETTLTWIDQNTPVNRYVNGVEILSNQKGGARMGYTIFGINGVAPTLTSTASRHYERYKIGDRYRRLTNIEYARIQGFPDLHCGCVSVYDQYALYGNAVPPPMAQWVLAQTVTKGVQRSAIPNNRTRTLFDYA